MNSLDGRLDLVRTSSDQHNLTIFNTPAVNPSWRYTDSISSPTPAYPLSVVPSDMNSDGLSDLVVLCNSSLTAGTLTIYYHSGNAISNANDNLFVTETELELGTVGDFNGDGSQELVFYNGTTDKILFYNITASRFYDLAAPSGAVALGAEDLNGDGWDDLVLANATVRKIWWGSKTFFAGPTSTTLISNMTPRSIGFGNLDGDDDLEMIIGCLGGLEIYWNDGSVSPYDVGDRFNLTLPGGDATAVQTGFFSGDGDLLEDIAIVNAISGRVEIYYQQSTSPKFTSTSRLQLTLVPNVDDLICTDLNGDNRTDLATHSDDTLYLFLQFPAGFQGGPEFPVKVKPGQGVVGLTAGNLDDVGIEELSLLSENSTVTALSYDSVNNVFVPMTVQTMGAAPGLLMVADMNKDGKKDIVAISALSRAVSFYYQNNFAPVASGNAVGSGFLEGAPVSFDGSSSTDSDSDIATLNYTWIFSYDGVEYGKTCNHVFMWNGTFTVTLTVRDRGGLTDNYILPPVIIGDLGPEAIGECIDSVLIENQTVAHFVDHSTSWPDPSKPGSGTSMMEALRPCRTRLMCSVMMAYTMSH